MFKFLSFLTASLLLICASSTATAQNSVNGVVVLDMTAAVLGTDYSQQRFEELSNQPDYAAAFSQAEEMRDELTKRLEGFERNSVTMNESSRLAEQRSLQEMQRQLQLIVGQVQQAQSILSEQLFTQMNSILESVVRGEMESRNAQMVLNRQGVIFAPPTTDITPNVVQELNKQIANGALNNN